jgi:phosphatidylserine/phosphatidylglycerophosphate/cardiolipin synthase-like enzyme
MNSSLFDETTFYDKFIADLNNCRKEVIIESPYITIGRMNIFMPIFKDLLERKVKIYIMTRDPKEHSESMEIQSEEAISQCEQMGVQILLCIGNHHRKLAILDREVLWEGSLNILSQNKSREIMRRIENETMTLEMFEFLKLNRFIY